MVPFGSGAALAEVATNVPGFQVVWLPSVSVQTSMVYTVPGEPLDGPLDHDRVQSLRGGGVDREGLAGIGRKGRQAVGGKGVHDGGQIMDSGERIGSRTGGLIGGGEAAVSGPDFSNMRSPGAEESPRPRMWPCRGGWR